MIARVTRTIEAATRIAISVADCGFLRAVINGVPVGEAADRYLGDGLDTREVKTRLTQILRAVDAYATSHTQDTRLIGALEDIKAAIKQVRANAAARRKSKVTKVPYRAVATATPVKDPARPPVSFDEFFAKENADGFYREAEVQTMYQDQVLTPWAKACAGGNSTGTSRLDAAAIDVRAPATTAHAKAKVIAMERMKRLLAAVNTFESAAAVEPALTDKVSVWITHDGVVRLLSKSRIRTVEQLHNRIKARGYNWHDGISGIGERKARQIAFWLSKAAPSLGIDLPVTSLMPMGELKANHLVPVAPRLMGVVPIERLLVPFELSGVDGVNRANRVSLAGVTNDYEAVTKWLATFKDSAHTYRRFRLETERFLLWCLFERGIALSSVELGECEAYAKFLRDPQPAVKWVYSDRCSRDSAKWRPFQSAMGTDGVDRALVVCSSMFNWLCAAGYLAGNPFKLGRRKAKPADREAKQAAKQAAIAKHRTKRILSIDVWSMVDSYLLALDLTTPADARTNALLRLAQGSGLRAEEIGLAQAGDIQAHKFDDDSTTFRTITVRGKGDTIREVELPDDTLEALAAHFEARGLTGGVDHVDNKDAYLIGSIRLVKEPTLEDRTGGVSYNVIYKVATDAFANVLKQNSENVTSEQSGKLKRASTHWLRHAFASQQVQGGTNIEALREMLGHKSAMTTQIYATQDRQQNARSASAARSVSKQRMRKLQANTVSQGGHDNG